MGKDAFFCGFAEGVFNPFSVLNVFDGYKFSNYFPNDEVRYGFLNFLVPYSVWKREI